MYLIIAIVVSAYRGIFVRGESVSEGVNRMKDNMNNVLRAGDRHKTSSGVTSKSPMDIEHVKHASIDNGSGGTDGLDDNDTSMDPEDNQNLLS